MGTGTWPYEMLVAPAEVWIAPVGETFPDLADAPAGNWAKLADKDALAEEGVTLRYGQDVDVDNSRVLGSTLPRKAFRSRENVEVEFTVKDLSAATLSKALDLAKAVTDTAAGAGTAGNLNFVVERGLTVGEKAVLVRYDASPDAVAATDDFKFQVEVYRAVQTGAPEPNPQKDNPGAVAFTLTALEDSSGNFVTVRSQDAAAT